MELATGPRYRLVGGFLISSVASHSSSRQQPDRTKPEAKSKKSCSERARDVTVDAERGVLSDSTSLHVALVTLSLVKHASENFCRAHSIL